MQVFIKITVLLLGVYLISCASSTKDLDRLKARVKHLETRLNSESKFRDEDFTEITERLDDIDNVLNATIGKEEFIPAVVTKVSKIDFETMDILKEDFTRLRTAFTEEKSEAVRFRREIPKIQNNLISLNEDVNTYCKVSLNNTDQLLTSFETVKQVTEVNIITSENDSKMLQNLVEQVQNIDTLVTNLISHINDIFSAISCRSLKSMGKADNGIYKLGQGFKVYCDQTTDGGGWVVFQRRLTGETDFYRNWTQYKTGFGDLDGEFWLGNDHLSLLTSDGEHELRIEIEDFKGNSAYAKYSKFKIYPEVDNYKLEISGYSGTAGDSLAYHNGMIFSTYDRSNTCAILYRGAWWYDNCYNSNLNGEYINPPDNKRTNGVTWFHWKSKHFSLKKVEMKFR